MIDINFYMNVIELKELIKNGSTLNKDFVSSYLESSRNNYPVLYEIETTNICNMKCIMCPRGNGLMTRRNETMSVDMFKMIIAQINPWTKEEIDKWDVFCADYYNIKSDEMSENHFFCNVIAKCLTLHGWGDPLLDPTIEEKVQICTNKAIPTYFSCNPSNININKTKQIMESGLTYLKYSIDAVNDIDVKKIRGKNASFSNSYRDICEVIGIKNKFNYKTVIVITMINIDGLKEDDFDILTSLFKDKDVYIYLKSENSQWLKDNQKENPSIHWSEFCQFPWSSFAILSNGDCVICSEDFDGKVKLGNVKEQTLEEIWNNNFISIRNEHIYGGVPSQCERCDMKAIYKEI